MGKKKFFAYTVQKMKFSIKDLFSKCDQIRSKLWIWSHLMKKSLMENFIFCAELACEFPYSNLRYWHPELKSNSLCICQLLQVLSNDFCKYFR